MSARTPEDVIADFMHPAWNMSREARAILTALRAAGYAVVPVDATEAQTRAAAHLDWNAQIDPTWGEIYRVMIAAVDTPGGDGVE